MTSRDDTAARFDALPLHDATVAALRITAPLGRRRASSVELDVVDSNSGRTSTLVFSGCASVRLFGDFAVLADNAALGNVDRVEASVDDAVIESALRAEMPRVNVEYLDADERPSADHPTLRSVRSIGSLVLFRVLMFGGMVEVIARRFKCIRSTARCDT